MQRHQYDRAYQFIQMAIQCHRQQTWSGAQLNQNDLIARQKNDRKREERLKKKKTDIEVLFTPSSDHDDDGEELFRELALSEDHRI